MRASRSTSLLAAAVAVLLGACTSTTELRPADQPVVAVDGPALDARMTAVVVASGVTFELRITDMQTAPLTAHFNTSQQYDFRVRRLDGSTVWTWSADKGFTTALTSRTFAPGETVVYTATWTPTERGSFVVDGWLTSSSHAALASAPLSVP
ncbi:MAG: hypothetical protein HOQ31_01145 [Gemmatimonadaceae bacterium]|nr:hypothetical protein [Gemmatimonadaceae bacterium]